MMFTHVLDAPAVEKKADKPAAHTRGVVVHFPRLFTVLGVPATTRVVTRPAVVRRRMSAESGRAIEKLGHAIEYLTDEFVHDGCEDGLKGPRVGAIQLLMSLNREVYGECPIVPTLTQRVARIFHSA
jgi:hypothetical protein